MLVKQIKENEDFLVDEILMGIDDDKDAIIWRNFIRRTRPYEVKFTRVLKGLFREQEKEVLANMRAHPKAYRYWPLEGLIADWKQNWLSQWLFAEMMWRKRFGDNGKIFIGGVMEDVGQFELTNLVVGIDFDVNSPAVIAFQKKFIEKYSKVVNETTLDSLRKTLQAGVAAGESMPDLSKRVGKVFDFADKQRSLQIARSETIRASNFGAEEAYRQSGVCSGKTWLTAADERVCPECEAMNGKKAGLGKSFDIGKLDVDLDYTEGAMPHPPLHVLCRCTITAILIGD